MVSGILAATGYGLGVLAVWLARHLSKRPLPQVRPVAWWRLAGVAGVAIAAFLYQGSRWQRERHAMIVRLLWRAAQRLGALLGRWVPATRAGSSCPVDRPRSSCAASPPGSRVRRPIRVYAGLDSAATSRERAELAVRELHRTGAFSRRVLCVVTTTGTGWVPRPGRHGPS